MVGALRGRASTRATRLTVAAAGLVTLLSVTQAGVFPGSTANAPRAEASTTAERGALEAYGRLPLAFVPNAGQTDARVRYKAQAGAANFYLTPIEAVFALTKGVSAPEHAPQAHSGQERATWATCRSSRRRAFRRGSGAKTAPSTRRPPLADSTLATLRMASASASTTPVPATRSRSIRS